MNTISIEYSLKIKWKIKGFDNYVFTENKKLFNLQTGREIRQILNGGSYGYCLKGRFYTLNKLKLLVYKDQKIDLPF
jgi:hypothetical protein